MTSRSEHHPAPSSTLWAAALSGLLGVGGACSNPKQPALPGPADSATVADSPAPLVDSPLVQVDAPTPDAGPAEKITSTMNENLTYTQFTAMCDQAGGYTMVNAQCVGTNICAGFTYQDWDPGELIYHTCNAVNGCNGISCVVLPPDSGKQALDILGATWPATEGVNQQQCANCHAKWNDTETAFDATYFRVHVDPGSGRDISNWMNLPAEAQARIIAFGKQGVYTNTGTAADNVAFVAMAPYYKLYSRAEIERVVAYLRGLDSSHIIFDPIKAYDPAMMMMARRRPGHGRQVVLPAIQAKAR